MSKILIGIEEKKNIQDILKINLNYKLHKIPNFKYSNSKLIDPRSWKTI